MRDIVDTLKVERDSILAERSNLTTEIKKLQDEHSSLSDRLFHIEKLLISYGSQLHIASAISSEEQLTPLQDSEISRETNKKSRPNLRPEFNGCSLIEAIGKVLSEEPEKIFDPVILIERLFDADRTHDQYATAKRSLTAELSRGAKESRWYKLPKKRGKYRFNKGDIELEQSQKYKSPRELKNPQFQGSSYIDACTQLLAQNIQGMSLSDLAKEIFIPGSSIENEKAETSLSVELNRAVREHRLYKMANSNLYCLVEQAEGIESLTEIRDLKTGENPDRSAQSD